MTITSLQSIIKLFSEPSNDSRLLGVLEEEKDEDLLEEDDLEKEDESEVPPEMAFSLRGEELLAKFKLKGARAEQVSWFLRSSWRVILANQ